MQNPPDLPQVTVLLIQAGRKPSLPPLLLHIDVRRSSMVRRDFAFKGLRGGSMGGNVSVWSVKYIQCVILSYPMTGVAVATESHVRKRVHVVIF